MAEDVERGNDDWDVDHIVVVDIEISPIAFWAAKALNRDSASQDLFLGLLA